ncbi:RING/U-box superfamily protein [Euphorbia peplus]|nr:RING/U-box superfamily protein [Euphorbia peplus]
MGWILLHLWAGLNKCNPDINRRSRADLAQNIAHALKSSMIFPLHEVTVDVDIIQQQPSWIPVPILHHHQHSRVDDGVLIMDGGDVVEEESGETGTGASKLSLSKLMKQRFWYCNGAGGDGEEECSICWEKYVEEIEAIKMPCNHVFHQKCILQWLKTKASCPLCRQTI